MSNSAAPALEARYSAEGMRIRIPFAAIQGMRLSLEEISLVFRPLASAKPEPPASASAGIKSAKPKISRI